MKALIYTRQSFGAEEGSVSISVQQEACAKWAREHNIAVVGEYSDANTSSELYPLCDEGIEAARIDRGYQRWLMAQRTAGRKQFKEGLGKAFQRIAQGGITHLLVYTRNRLGRTADGSYLDRFLTNYLLEHRVSLVTVQDGTVMDFSDDFMSLVMSIKDTLDYKGLREKAKASLASIDRRINSYTKWSNAFGVEMVDGKVTFNNDCAEAVRYAIEQVVAGASYPSILKVLNGKYRSLFNGKQCYASTLNNILKNPVYCGYMRNREGVLDRAVNIPAPVVSYALWNKAQEVMRNKKTNAGKYNVKGERKHWLPLSGYLRCTCGRRMQVVFDRSAVAYKCINDGSHSTPAFKVDEDTLKTIQSLFIVRLIESRTALAAAAKSSERVDRLKCRIEKLQASLRAKVMLVETEEDAQAMKPVLDEIRKEIAAVKADLLNAQAVDATEQARLQEQLEKDFEAIMEGELLDEADYQRLLQETVDHFDVDDDKFGIHLTNGVSFTLPRIEGKWHSRRLPKCEIECDTTDDTIEGIAYYRLYFYDGELTTPLRGECIYEDDSLSVHIM